MIELDDKTVNNMIDDTINRFNNIDNIKDLPEIFKDYLVIVCVGMRLRYNNKYDDLIFNNFSKINYALNKKDFYNKANKQQIEQYNKLLTLCDEDGIGAHMDISFMLASNNGIKVNRLLCLSDNNVDNVELLENLTHEIHHSLTTLNHTFVKNNNGNYFRNGYNLIPFNKNYKNIGNGFNEVINTMATWDIMDYIIRLKFCDIENNNIKKLVNTMNLSYEWIINGYKSDSYDDLISICSIFYDNKKLREFIVRCMIDGNINEFINIFNNNCNINYNSFIDCLDCLYRDYIKGSNLYIDSNTFNIFSGINKLKKTF